MKEAIAKAAEIKEEEVTPSSWERVQAAKAAAEKVVADFEKDETSVTQSQIDAAAKALQDALILCRNVQTSQHFKKLWTASANCSWTATQRKA